MGELLMRSAFVTYGGWEGHRPRECAQWVAGELRALGFDVELADALAPLPDQLSLIVPVWSIAEAPAAELDALIAEVERGAGLAAFHGAAATFHSHHRYRRLIGGTFVWHPDESRFEVEPLDGSPSFELTTEQYYLHVDPANEVIARTTFADGTAMPVAWRRREGAGRVFYSALGHSPEVLALDPVRSLFLDGVRWAARASRSQAASPDS
jgi:type 1 glutamine amidotransferase